MAVSEEARDPEVDVRPEALASSPTPEPVASASKSVPVTPRPLGGPAPAPLRLRLFGDDRGRQVAHSVIGGLLLLGGVLIVAGPRRGSEDGADPKPHHAAMSAPSTVSDSAGALIDYDAAPREAAAADKPHVPAWRVADLRSDPSIEIFEGKPGKRTLAVALKEAHIPRADVFELYRAFEGVHRLDRRRPQKDAPSPESFVVARDREKGRLVAFEHVISPFEVWQARREGSSPAGGGSLVAHKLELSTEHRHVARALALSSDLAKAIHDAGLREEAIEGIDDALEGHVELTTLKAGARVRLLATEDWVEGTFARFHVDAVELAPPEGSPVRVYAYEPADARTTDGVAVDGARRRRAMASFAGYYDAKGQQPYRGTFRAPLPFTRVTSRFNPKRMHPVLHTIKPHNGVDFGAATGTSVFAAASGRVESVGNGGRCGNMVKIAHPNGLSTAYCHLSKFAAGLRAGQQVEARQLIGYVGQTGSATGPHLHFAVKRGGNFIDPLSLKIDGVRVLPASARLEFNKSRAEFDIALDAIPLPPAVVGASSDEPDDDNDKDDD